MMAEQLEPPQSKQRNEAANVQAVRGPLDENALAANYREILSTSRALQRPTRVAHLGPHGVAQQARVGQWVRMKTHEVATLKYTGER